MIRALQVLSLLCLAFPAAYATPILYSFGNTSGFSLNGTTYPPSHMGVVNTYRYQLSFLTDTDNAVPHYFTDPFTGTTALQYESTSVGTGIVGYNGMPLAYLTDSLQYVHCFFPGSTFPQCVSTYELIDFTRDVVLVTGGSDYAAGLGIGTTLGPLDVSAPFAENRYSATPNPTSVPLPPATSAPEPSSLLLLGTGALTLLGGWRRWSDAS